MTTDKLDAPEIEDPILEARIQHALLPYVDLLTPDGLAEARRLVTLVLTTHPVATRLMDRLREQSTQGSSGVRASRPGEAPAAELKRRAHGNGKQGRGR